MAKRKLKDANLLTGTFSSFVNHRPPDDYIYMTSGLNPDNDGWWLISHPLFSREPFFIQRVINNAWAGTYLTVWSDSNLTIGGYDAPGDNAAKTIVLPNGTPPTTNISGAQIYAADGEAKVRDAFGNVTTFSPHHFDQIQLDPDDSYPVVVHHQNAYLGKEETIYLSKLARLVEQLTGEQLVWSRDLSPAEKRDFAADEILMQQQRAAEIQQHREHVAAIYALPEDQRQEKLASLLPEPTPHTPRQTPDWIKTRVEKQGR